MAKYEIDDQDLSVLSIREVAEQMMSNHLEANERIGDVRLECGCDLEVDIHIIEPDDPKIDGYLDRTEIFTMSDIRDDFTYCDAYVWAKDEDGEDVLIGINRTTERNTTMNKEVCFEELLKNLIVEIERPVGGSRKELEKQCADYDAILRKTKNALGMEVA